MKSELTLQDRERIEAGIRARYRRVAVSPAGEFRYPTGREGLETLGYPPEILRTLPEVALASYCGVGNPFSLGTIQPGERILDVGCGAGVDSLVAGVLTGPAGQVTGIDPIPEMVARARQNARLAVMAQVNFQEGSAGALPFPDEALDLVISNGVFNLVVDKAEALAEVRRVLKPGGRFWLADQVLVSESPGGAAFRVENWAR